MALKTVTSPDAPAAVGPYSPALVDNDRRLVFISGQVPIDPKSGKLVPGDIQQQTQQALRNLQTMLEAAGSGMDRVRKTTVFLADMNDFKAMNEIYAQAFPDVKPARSAFEVSRLPLDAKVEIEAIATL